MFTRSVLLSCRFAIAAKSLFIYSINSDVSAAALIPVCYSGGKTEKIWEFCEKRKNQIIQQNDGTRPQVLVWSEIQWHQLRPLPSVPSALSQQCLFTQCPGAVKIYLQTCFQLFLVRRCPHCND